MLLVVNCRQQLLWENILESYSQSWILSKIILSMKRRTNTAQNILGLCNNNFQSSNCCVPLLRKAWFGNCQVYFFFTWAHYDIINTALHLSRTSSHLANVERKVCQWSRGHSTRDLWKYMICGVLPLKQFCHLQATYGKQPTYITKCRIMDTYSPTVNTELFLWKLIIGDLIGSLAERARCQ